MSHVFVLDTNKQALNPVHPGRARLLLKAGKAAVYRRYPFTIMLQVAISSPRLDPLRLKLDPGSKTTGLALVNDASGEVVWAAELTHRGQAIKKALDERHAVRRRRRQRKTRYRKPRFQNRHKRTGTLPPSLESRVCNVLTWVRRLMKLCPVSAISQEVVKFDTQALENPDIESVQYQQGTLAGYEIREYVLLKWGHHCVYCDAENIPLQLDHVQARSKQGSNRASNLVPACSPCNQRKGNQDVRDFLSDQPDLLSRILAQLKTPLKDAAAVNVTRWMLYERLLALGLPVECGSGGRTKFNRVTRALPKAHWLDAACVGASTPEHLSIKHVVPWCITANGHGCRQMCLMDKYGFPRTGPKQGKRVKGFQTGDMVRAVVTSGTKQGIYTGRVAVRSRGTFNITTRQGTITDIHHRFCTLLSRSDGYSYSLKGAAALPPTA